MQGLKKVTSYVFFLRKLFNQKEGRKQERGRCGIGETQEQDKGTPQHDGEEKSQDDSCAASREGN